MKSKQTLIIGTMAAVNLLMVVALGYGLFSVKDTLSDRIAEVEATSHQETPQDRSPAPSLDDEKKLAALVSDLELIKKRIGVTSTELKHARETTQDLKRQQEEAAREMASQLAVKAN